MNICIDFAQHAREHTVNVLKSDSDSKVGQTEKVSIILIVMEKLCRTFHCDSFKNSLDVMGVKFIFIFTVYLLIKSYSLCLQAIFIIC